MPVAERKGRKQRSAPERGYTVGITIFVKADGSLALFENGLRQNVLFLYLLFRNAPNCKRVYLLNHGDGEVSDIPSNLGIPLADIVRTPTVLDELDYVIGLGAAIDRPTVTALKERGCRMICYKGGNGAVISMEATVAKPTPRPDAELYFDHDYYDAIWMTPQHIHTYRGWCETIYRRPVYEVQQVWSPLMIETAAPHIRERFGYRASETPWRVGVMDPNITVMKTSHMPMLVCEAAYRRRPEAFKAMYISNAWPHRESPHFRSFAVSLEASKAGVMTMEPRFVSSDFLANHCDAVVTHHWENGLNYLYYEVLYGGYPLIHNSEFLSDCGYYYPSFEAEAGADALLAAFENHDSQIEDYRRRSQVALDRVSPANPELIALHERLLVAAGDPAPSPALKASSATEEKEPSSVEATFTEVYRRNVWLGGESRSGQGSTRKAAQQIIRELPVLFRELKVRSILDAPCGDFAWMREVDLGDIDYTGADIVGPLIAANTAAYGSPSRRFVNLDLTSDPLPRVDLILCRDCFIHLPLRMIFEALRQMVDSGASYLLLSHYPWRAQGSNANVPEVILGGRRINLETAPFNFPPPRRSIVEASVTGPLADIAGDKSLALWAVEDIANIVRKAAPAS